MFLSSLVSTSKSAPEAQSAQSHSAAQSVMGRVQAHVCRATFVSTTSGPPVTSSDLLPRSSLGNRSKTDKRANTMLLEPDLIPEVYFPVPTEISFYFKYFHFSLLRPGRGWRWEPEQWPQRCYRSWQQGSGGERALSPTPPEVLPCRTWFNRRDNSRR